MGSFSFYLQQRISDRIAFPIILIVGLTIAWFTISVGEKIIASFPESNTVEFSKNYDLPEDQPLMPAKPVKK